MTGKKINFGSEIAKLLPIIIREATRRQANVFSKGKLSIPHLVILEFIDEKGPATMGELAKALQLSMGAVTSIVDKMIKMNLVKRERSQEDRRVVWVVPLKKGTETAKQVMKWREDMTNDLFSVLTESEKKEYLRLLKKVYSNLR